MLACVPGPVDFELSASVGIWAPTNTTYRCLSPTTITITRPSVTFSEMKLEAYMPGNDFSPAGMFLANALSKPLLSVLGADQTFVASFIAERVCAADQTTTGAPTTTTSAATPTTPSPTPAGTPEQGSYSVKNASGTVCLMAKMGVQLNVSYFSQSQNKVRHSSFYSLRGHKTCRLKELWPQNLVMSLDWNSLCWTNSTC